MAEDIEDINIEEEPQTPESGATPQEEATPPQITPEEAAQPSVSVDEFLKLKEQLKELEEDKTQREHIQAHNDVIASLKTKYDDFDEAKIENYLQELYKTDPKRAEELNTAVGFELVYTNEFKTKAVDNDNPAFGRNIPPVDRSEAVLEKVKNGDFITIDDEMAMLSGSL